MSTVKTKLREALANTALVVVSVLIFYAAAEFVFFRLMLPHLSVNLRAHLPDRADFFLQNAKAQYLPRDYILLLGDSYAQGLGDWLLSIEGRNDKPYHSANILHERLGQDVVTIGRSGAGSAEAMVQLVTRVYGDDYCYLFPPIEPPKRMVLYFYEGNDLDDNFDLVQKRVRPGSDRAADIDRFLASDYAHVSAWRCHGHLGDTIFRMSRFAVRQYITGMKPVLDLPPRNALVIGGARVDASILQVPGMGLTEDAYAAALSVYDRSLAWLRRRFPGVSLSVAYIASPAAVYRYASAEMLAKDVYVFEPGRPARPTNDLSVQVSAVYASSQRMCAAVRAVTLRHGADFVDLRPTLRQAGAVKPLHGPRDWNHFNEAGYRVVGAVLAERLRGPASDICDPRTPE